MRSIHYAVLSVGFLVMPDAAFAVDEDLLRAILAVKNTAILSRDAHLLANDANLFAAGTVALTTARDLSLVRGQITDEQKAAIDVLAVRAVTTLGVWVGRDSKSLSVCETKPRQCEIVLREFWPRIGVEPKETDQLVAKSLLEPQSIHRVAVTIALGQVREAAIRAAELLGK